MRPYVQWTTNEDRTFVQMRGDGANPWQIARALKRSVNAVMSRITIYNRHMRATARSDVPLPPFIAPPIPIPMATITKADVPKFYELGWRFVNFDGDHCVFEWRSSREPRWPQ